MSARLKSVRPGIVRRGSLVVAVGLAITGPTVLSSPAAATRPLDSTPCAARLISAHGGYTAATDADTVQSQIAAYDIGANIADSDIWKTKDNHFVQIHDNDVSYSTDGTGLVTNMTLEQVQALHTTPHQQPVPTLAESLALPQFAEPGRYLMFETKWSMQGNWALKLMDDEIKAAGMSSHVIIYSAYMNQVRYLSTIDPELTLWFKSGSKPPPVSQMIGLDGVMIAASDLRRADVKVYHESGLSVIRGKIDVETETAWAHFVARGADGLMTEDPAVMVDRCRTLSG